MNDRPYLIPARQVPYVLSPLDEALEDWETCLKTECTHCGYQVRTKYFVDHLWISHGLRTELAPIEESA